MSSSKLIRWSSLALAAAGVLLLVAELLELWIGSGDDPFRVLALTGRFHFQLWLYLLGVVLLLVGLVGLYARGAQVTGVLGIVGFLIAFVGTVFFAGFFYTNIFVAPALAVGAPEFLDRGRLPGFPPAITTYAIGWLVFGLALLRSRLYPVAPLIVLTAGAAIDLLARPFSGVVIDAAFVWLGVSLFLKQEQ
jgi:hypothetical protein